MTILIVEDYNNKKKNCMVHNCNNESEFINPDSKMVYCEEHYNQLGGKIIHQKYSKKNGIIQKEIATRLIKIPKPDFDIMKVE